VRDRQVSTQRKVTSEAITGGSRKEPRQPYPIPGHCILLADDFGDGGRVQWVSGRPGDAPAYAGTDFIIARGGRIAAIYLFFDKLS
jgi:hypothetical protein